MSSRKRTLKDAEALAEKKPRGPQRCYYGLYNQGNTCYLNSVLQVLSMTKEINERLHPELKSTDRELKSLFEKLKKDTSRTEKITQCLDLKNVNQQRDAAECLEMILQKLSPQASQVFQGQLMHMTKCSKGHIIIAEKNPFWTLPLPLKDSVDATYSMQQTFERIFQKKPVSIDNMVYCNDCKEKTGAIRQCEMVESPQILTILLKRFDLDHKTRSHFKSDHCVGIPLVLQTKKKKYELYGMVNHMGSMRGGHYTATVLSNDDKTWYEFNDAHVDKLEEQPFGRNSTYNSATAYLIMYRASRGQREKVREHKDEHLDEERRLRESDADGRDNRQNQRSNRGEGENSGQLAKCSFVSRNKPILIAAIVFGCIVIGIILIVCIVKL